MIVNMIWHVLHKVVTCYFVPLPRWSYISWLIHFNFCLILIYFGDSVVTRCPITCAWARRLEWILFWFFRITFWSMLILLGTWWHRLQLRRRFLCFEQYHIVVFLVPSNITQSFSLCRAISRRCFPCVEQYHAVFFLVLSNIMSSFSLCRTIWRRCFPCVEQYHIVIFPVASNIEPLFFLWLMYFSYLWISQF